MPNMGKIIPEMGNNYEDDKPPSHKTDMGIGTRMLSSYDSLVRRFKGFRELWDGEWSICPVRTSLHSRCLFIPMDIQKIGIPNVRCEICGVVCTGYEAGIHKLETGHNSWELEEVV